MTSLVSDEYLIFDPNTGACANKATRNCTCNNDCEGCCKNDCESGCECRCIVLSSDTVETMASAAAVPAPEGVQN